MTLLRDYLRTSPAHARVAPYVIILILTFVQDALGGQSRYWLYLLKMLIGLWCIWEMRSLAPEVRWAFSPEGFLVGVLVFVLWVGLDDLYPKFGLLFKTGGPPWNPFQQFGDSTAPAWFFWSVRTFGSAIVVPPIEEAFYRSFLYRYFVRTDFTEMPLNQRHWLSFFVTSGLFGILHYQWLAGILCGMAFQALVLRKNRLGDAITAHAVTNFLLGLWAIWQDDWRFW